MHVAGLSLRLGDSQGRAVPPPSNGDSQGRGKLRRQPGCRPQGRATCPSRAVLCPPHPQPWLRWRPARPRLAYPVLLLPALSIALLSLHLQGDGGQAVLRPHQLLRQRRLLGLLQGQGLGRGREQRARGVGWSWACLGLSPTLASEMCPLGARGPDWATTGGARAEVQAHPLGSPRKGYNSSNNNLDTDTTRTSHILKQGLS